MAPINATTIRTYLSNVRELLYKRPEFFGVMVERQIRGRLLPRLQGQRTALETPLWELLTFCIHGHETPPPQLSNEALESVRTTVAQGQGEYPGSAQAVLRAFDILVAHDIFPAPRKSRT